MKNLKRYVSLSLLFLFAMMLKAQQNDFGLWGGVAVEKKISKSLEANIEGEFRSRNNVRTAERLSGSAGLMAASSSGAFSETMGDSWPGSCTT